MMSGRAHSELWIGLAEVASADGARVLVDRNGAFTNVIALADSAQMFELAVRQAVVALGLRLVSIEDAEPVRFRGGATALQGEVGRMAAAVLLDGQPRVATMHTWLGE